MFGWLNEIAREMTTRNPGGAAPGTVALPLAAAVLLVEVMRSAGGISAAERAEAVRALCAQFGVSEEEVGAVLREAEGESARAYDYFRFTNPLDEQLPQESKVALVAAMWRVAYADSAVAPEENAVISKVADLLHVSHPDYIAAKMRAAAANDSRA